MVGGRHYSGTTTWTRPALGVEIDGVRLIRHRVWLLNRRSSPCVAAQLRRTKLALQACIGGQYNGKRLRGLRGWRTELSMKLTCSFALIRPADPFGNRSIVSRGSNEGANG